MIGPIATWPSLIFEKKAQDSKLSEQLLPRIWLLRAEDTKM